MRMLCAVPRAWSLSSLRTVRLFGQYGAVNIRLGNSTLLIRPANANLSPREVTELILDKLGMPKVYMSQSRLGEVREILLTFNHFIVCGFRGPRYQLLGNPQRGSTTHAEGDCQGHAGPDYSRNRRGRESSSPA